MSDSADMDRSRDDDIVLLWDELDAVFRDELYHADYSFVAKWGNA